MILQKHTDIPLNQREKRILRDLDLVGLKDKIDEHDYLQDLVEEKKAQITFLQSQVEQRIKNLYQSEHQRLQTVAEMKQLRAAA